MIRCHWRARVAGRALSGDGAWNEYVVATVKDASLPPAERFAPLAYLVQTNQMADARKLLDDGVIAALVDVLPALVDDPARGVSSAVDLLATLSAMDSPSVIDLMLASLDRAQTPASRLFIVEGLGTRRDDPACAAGWRKSPPVTPTCSCANEPPTALNSRAVHDP